MDLIQKKFKMVQINLNRTNFLTNIFIFKNKIMK